MCYYKANKPPCICKMQYLVRPCWRATFYQSWNENSNPIIQPCGVVETARDVPPRSCFQCESLVALKKARTAAKATKPVPSKRHLRQLPQSNLSTSINPIEAFYRSHSRNPQLQNKLKMKTQRRLLRRPPLYPQKQMMNTFTTAPQNQISSQPLTPTPQQQQPPTQQTDNLYDLSSMSNMLDLPPISQHESDRLMSVESPTKVDVETENREPNAELTEIRPDTITTASPSSQFINAPLLSSPSLGQDETLLLPDSMSDIFANFTWSEM
jgi:hypothetical protein